MFQVNPLPSRQRIHQEEFIRGNIKPYLRKIKVKIKMSSAAIFVWLFKG